MELQWTAALGVFLGALVMAALTPVVRRLGKRCIPREILCVLLVGAVGWILGGRYPIWGVAVGVAFAALVTAVAVIDQDTMEIPDRFHFALAAVGIAAWRSLPDLTLGAVPLRARLIGLVCVSLPMLAICFLIDGAFGGGDIKLMAVCGWFLGWKLTLLATFLAILCGGAWGAVLLARKKAGGSDHFAFGPFLCGGMLIALLWGEQLLNAYLGLFVFS